jgi:hypothetical protein
MRWGASDKSADQGIGGAKPGPTLIIATATLVLGSILPRETALASTDCSSAAAPSTVDTTVGGHSRSLHSVSLRFALHGNVGTPGTASSQASCHSGGALVSVASALLPRSYVARPLIDGYSVSTTSGTVAREMRMEVNPRTVSPGRGGSTAAPGASSESESGLEARFGVRWQTLPGPAWVQRVPSWLVEDAKTYHRRGLPVLNLWQSSRYVVALGLSNHGVPGVYISQKLP